MEEEFYAVIKLVSGEEIFSKVCPCKENNRTILLLDNPVTIESISIPHMKIQGVKMNQWISFTDETIFLIDMEKVITISEVEDKSILKMYFKFINKQSNTKASSKMGYLCSIDEARKSLEKIYRKN